MNADSILKLTRVKPFRPFRIAMSDGSKFDLHHPELVMVEPFFVTIGIPGPKGPEAPLSRIIQLSLRHVNSIEFLNTEASPARADS